MTENEAKIFIQNAMEQSRNALAELMLIMPKVFAVRKKSLGEYYSNLENCKKEIEACEIAVKALEDVQQYRAIGTPEELQTMKEHGGFTGIELANIAAMQMKLKEYEAIGTLEEYMKFEDECISEEFTLKSLLEAGEKQKAKKPDYEGDGYSGGHLVYDTWICPCCGKHYEIDYDDYDFCPACGQCIDWSDEE